MASSGRKRASRSHSEPPTCACEAMTLPARGRRRALTSPSPRSGRPGEVGRPARSAGPVWRVRARPVGEPPRLPRGRLRHTRRRDAYLPQGRPGEATSARAFCRPGYGVSGVLRSCTNALEPHLATIAPEPLVPQGGTVLPPLPVSACRLAEYKRLEETPRGGVGGVRRRESAPARNLHDLSSRPGFYTSTRAPSLRWTVRVAYCSQAASWETTTTVPPLLWNSVR